MNYKLKLIEKKTETDKIYGDTFDVFDFGICKVVCYDEKIKNIDYLDVKIIDDIIYLTNRIQINLLKNCAII